MPRIVSFEGTSTSEMGGVPGENTTDSLGFCLDFEVETPGTFIGGGGVGLLQRIYVEADTEGQVLQCFVRLDGVETSFGQFSTLSKQMTEFAIDLTGYIASVRLASVNHLTTRIEVTAIELDMYVPEHND
jgi:hypothetical protein